MTIRSKRKIIPNAKGCSKKTTCRVSHLRMAKSFEFEIVKQDQWARDCPQTICSYGSLMSTTTT